MTRPHHLRVDRIRWRGTEHYAFLRCDDCYHEESVLLPHDARWSDELAATRADELAATRSAIHEAAPRRTRRKSPERLERDKNIGAAILTGLVFLFVVLLYVDSQNGPSDNNGPADTGGSGVDCSRLESWVEGKSANGEFTASESDNWRGIVRACRD